MVVADRVKAAARSFPVQAVAVMSAFSIILFWPLLAQRIPLPMDVILHFPVFDSIRGTHGLTQGHAQMGDLVTPLYQWHVFAAEILRSGHFPLWNPHLLMGEPLFAKYQPAVLYPIHLLYAVFPVHMIWALGFPLRVFLAGSFMILFLREIGASRFGAVVGGLAFSASGFMLTWSGWPHADVAVWLPLILYALLRIRKSPTVGRAALLAGAVAASLLGGHPQTAVYVLGSAGLFFGWLLLVSFGGGTSAGRVRATAFAVGGLCVGIGIAAVQLLPTAEWIPLTSRSANDLFSRLPMRQILGFVSRDTRATPNSAGVGIPEAASYIGMLSLILVPMAFSRRWLRFSIFFGALGALSLGAAFGLPLIYDATIRMPVLSNVPGHRVIFLAQFSACVLAAMGATALQESTHDPKPMLRRWIYPAFAALGGSVLLWRLFADSEPPVLWYLGPFSSASALGAGILLIALALSGYVRHRVLVGAALILLIVDLGSYAWGHVPFVRGRDIFPSASPFTALRALDPGTYRIASVDGTYPKNTELVYGFDSPAGTGYHLSLVSDLLRGRGEETTGFVLTSKGLLSPDDRLFDLMNVKYVFANTYNGGAKALAQFPERFEQVLSDHSVRVFRNKRVLPRAFVVPVGGVIQATDHDDAVSRVKGIDFDPERSVVLEGRFSEPAVSVTSVATSVTAIRIQPNGIDVDVDGAGAGVLVLTDVLVPGWHVSVDGKGRELYRADAAFKGVWLTPGDRVVSFRYRPGAFTVGVIVSLFSVGLLLVALVGSFIRHRYLRNGRGLKRSRGAAQVFLAGVTIVLALVLLVSGLHEGIRVTGELIGARSVASFDREYAGWQCVESTLKAALPEGAAIMVDPQTVPLYRQRVMEMVSPRNRVVTDRQKASFIVTVLLTTDRRECNGQRVQVTRL